MSCPMSSGSQSHTTAQASQARASQCEALPSQPPVSAQPALCSTRVGAKPHRIPVGSCLEPWRPSHLGAQGHSLSSGGTTASATGQPPSSPINGLDVRHGDVGGAHLWQRDGRRGIQVGSPLLRYLLGRPRFPQTPKQVLSRWHLRGVVPLAGRPASELWAGRTPVGRHRGSQRVDHHGSRVGSIL